MVEIVIPSRPGSSGVSVSFPSSAGSATSNTTFPRAANYIEIALSVVGPVPVGVIARPIIAKPIRELTAQAEGSGSGVVTFEGSDGLIATVTYPAASVALTGRSLSGRVTITASGALSDVSITLGGLR